MSNLRERGLEGEEGRVGSREEGEGKIDLTSDSLGVGGVVKTKRNPLGAVHWWYWGGKKKSLRTRTPERVGRGGRYPCPRLLLSSWDSV